MIKQNGHECVWEHNKIRRIIDVEKHESLLKAEQDLGNTRATLIVNYAEKQGRCQDGVRLTDEDLTKSTVIMLVKVFEQYAKLLRATEAALKEFTETIKKQSAE